MTFDYYAVLGVRRDATAEEIKIAYRRLARELHPDVNPDTVTQEQFKEVTQAHQVLSDTDKRQIYDLGGDPFAAAGGYFGQARTERSKQNGHPRDRWESHRERWPPGPSDGARNQTWDQTPSWDYRSRQPPSFPYDWRPPLAVKPHRPRPIFEAIVLICGVLALAILVAARAVTHSADSLHATAVIRTKTILVMNAIWAFSSLGAAPAMTAEQAWATWSHSVRGRPTVQLGLITQPIGAAQCGPACPVQNELAYGYHWTACMPGTNLPATKCWNWLFVDANTGAVITAWRYDEPPGP